jgi:NADH-quinone oxidoreductase subunit H
MDWNFILFTAVKIACVFAVVMTMVAYSVLVERKLCAVIQDRVGPNRAAPPFIAAIPVIGPFLVRLGLFHPLADGLKLILKEDFTPAHVRRVYYWLAPAITMIPALLTVAIIPFGFRWSLPTSTSASSTPSASCRSACMALSWPATRATRSIPSSAAFARARR